MPVTNLSGFRDAALKAAYLCKYFIVVYMHLIPCPRLPLPPFAPTYLHPPCPCLNTFSAACALYRH